MINEYKFDILTPLFCTGADAQLAELRASEVRGVLRWWFRVLGGLKDSTQSVHEQEREIFGGIEDGKPQKSMLTVRVARHPALVQQCKSADQFTRDNDGFEAGQNSPHGYLLFPLRDNPRAFFRPNKLQQEAFTLNVVWKGEVSRYGDIEALITVFGHLGSLGFRGRRCMGALAFHGKSPMSLTDALGRFAEADDAIDIRELRDGGDGAVPCTRALGIWLKSWRSYGPSNHRNDYEPGFRMASIDHDLGLGDRRGESAVRPAIGLPIIQRYSSQRRTNDWNPATGDRFASPVLLRPYRGENGGWKALVVFVDARKWQEGDRVQLKHGPSLDVSLDLYEAMREDGRLLPVQF